MCSEERGGEEEGRRRDRHYDKSGMDGWSRHLGLKNGRPRRRLPFGWYEKASNLAPREAEEEMKKKKVVGPSLPLLALPTHPIPLLLFLFSSFPHHG